MAEETIQILSLKVQGAESVADLRNNVTELKKALKEAEEQSNTPEGWAKYQETLEVLKQNQNALKDAMYATSGSLEDVKKSALGASTSYNSLVNKMAELKRQFRSTTDEVERAKLGTRINLLNSELKRLDELQGNFQRNVGNYQSQGTRCCHRRTAGDEGRGGGSRQVPGNRNLHHPCLPGDETRRCGQG